MTHKNVVRISEFVAPFVAPESRKQSKNDGSFCQFVAPKSKKQRKNEIKFTDLSIKNLKVNGRETFYCEGLDGFGIRVTPKGTKTWVLLYRLDGQKPQRYTIGHYPRISLAEARKKYGLALSKIEQGIDPNMEAQEIQKKREQEIVIDELIPLYIDYCKIRNEKRWKEKERALKRDASPTIGKMKVTDVSFREVSRIVNAVFTERNSVEGAKHLLSYLRTMFKYAKNGLGLIEVNPCADLESPKRRVKKQPRFLSPREIYLFWNNIDKASMSDVIKLGMKFMLCTLQRGIEVRTLEWSEINREDKTWIIPAEKAKNGTAHLVPLNDLAMGILDQIHPKTGHSKYVFGYTPIWKINPDAKAELSPLGETAFNHSSRVNFECYGIDSHFTPHELRKTGATTLTSMSFSREIVKKLLNHKPNDVTAVYDLFDYFEEKRAGMEVMNFVLNKILSSQGLDFVPSIKSLRRDIVTKGLIHEFMNEDYYTRKLNPSDKKLDYQTILPSPVSYTLSASLNV